MPESTLVLTYDQIRQRVGDLRGYGTTIADWADAEKEKIEFCVRDGSAMVYTQANHEWSFLAPLATVTLKSGASDLELPWDFGFITEHTVYFEDSVGFTMKIVNDAVILRQRQDNSTTTGRPYLGAIVTETKPGIQFGQRSHLIYWPVADANYDVNLRYQVLGSALSAATPMPYGGAAHANTILEACLYASERLDGIAQGPHAAMYAQALELSKAFDRRVKPRMFGYGVWDYRTGRYGPVAPWGPDNTNTVSYTPGA